jgi:hypothetical protein
MWLLGLPVPARNTGTAATFNGTTSRIQHPWNELFNPGASNLAGSFTVTAWAKPEGAATYQSVVTSSQAMNPKQHRVYSL